MHHQLRQYWLEDPAPYACLSPNEQWELHDFFQPYKALRDAELVAHRQAVSQRSPSLPQRAGRTLKRFETATKIIADWRARPPAQPTATKHKRAAQGDSVEVWPLVRPEIDATKIARALIALARWEQGL